MMLLLIMQTLVQGHGGAIAGPALLNVYSTTALFDEIICFGAIIKRYGGDSSFYNSLSSKDFSPLQANK